MNCFYASFLKDICLVFSFLSFPFFRKYSSRIHKNIILRFTSNTRNLPSFFILWEYLRTIYSR